MTNQLISNKQPMTTNNRNLQFDLEERTAKFGENVIKLCKKMPKNTITDPLVNQLVKAATSVGANYCEADNAESKKDFRHKIGIVKKEARESKHFLRMMKSAIAEFHEEMNLLENEARELNLIFNTIFRKVSN
jgi:four helix bundle protein